MSEEIKENVYELLRNGAISAAVAWLTAKWGWRKSIKEKRIPIYKEVLELLGKLKDDPYLVYNNTQFVTPLNSLKSGLNLIASQKVIDVLNPFYEMVNETASAYWERFNGAGYEQYRENRMQYDGATEVEMENEEDEYAEQHLLAEEKVEEIKLNVIHAMKTDIGTRGIVWPD